MQPDQIFSPPFPLPFPLHVMALFLHWCNLNLFPRCRLSDRHTWAWVCWILENLCVDNQDEVIILHSIHLEQNLSSLLFSFDYCAHTRKVNLHLWHPEDSYQIQNSTFFFFFYIRLLWQSHIFFHALPSHYPSIFSLCDGRANKVCCKSQYAYSKILNNTRLHLVVASWGKNHKL